jgi:hypothetical protein
MIESNGVGQNFTVGINISNVVDLYAWQAGMTFNPAVLECTGFYEGEFLNRSGRTWPARHSNNVNNTLGILYFRGYCLLGPVAGVNGSGQLASVTFRSVGMGVSDFHLTDIILLNSKLVDIPFEVVESFTVNVEATNYEVKIVNNLTMTTDSYGVSDTSISGVSGTVFNVSDMMIRFDARTMLDWFCQVIVPKTLLKCTDLSEWKVNVDGNPISYVANENSTHTSLQFTHAEGDHTVEILGNEVLGRTPIYRTPPLPYLVTIALLGFVALTVALLDFRKTRKTLGSVGENSGHTLF